MSETDVTSARNGAAAAPDYAQVRRRWTELAVREHEVPTEHEVSLPLPSLRWGGPAYASFAGPASRTPGAPLRVGTPDRWWATRASDLALLVYALTGVVPFADELPAGPVLAATNRSMREVRADQELFTGLMAGAVPRFFAGEPAGAVLGADLTAAVGVVLPAGLLPWYRRLTPDFFDWLDGAAT
jgi:hypothetical protein